WPGSSKFFRSLAEPRVEFFCGTTARLAQTRQVHPVAGTRSDQARAAHMHLADGVCHLLDRAYFLDDEPVRQKPLIDQLHHPLVSRVQPDRPEMLSTNLHGLRLLISNFQFLVRDAPIPNPALLSCRPEWRHLWLLLLDNQN